MLIMKSYKHGISKTFSPEDGLQKHIKSIYLPKYYSFQFVFHFVIVKWKFIINVEEMIDKSDISTFAALIKKLKRQS